jgi:hypothetical protein
MKKMRLDLEHLHVDTFETSTVEADRGTVRGHWSQIGTCDAVVATCQINGTCRLTCGSKCGSTTCE